MSQTSSDTNSGPPSGPLLNRTPDRSAWSVTIQGFPQSGESPLSDSGSSGSSGDEKSPVLAQSTVMKSGDTIYEQNTGADGRVHQIWHIKGLKVEKGSDGTPVVGPDSGGGDIYSANFQNSDFAGLDWVSADTYQGKIKFKGSDVIVFKQNLSPMTADVHQANVMASANAAAVDLYNKQHGIKAAAMATPPPVKLVPAVGYIDFKSRLPLIVTIGGEKRTYQYAPLSTSIPMPPEIAKALSDYAQRIKLLSQ